MANPPKEAKGHPPCPTKWGPPPGKSKTDDPDQPCGKANGKGEKKNDKGAKGGIILVVPMTLMTAAYAVRSERLRPRRRAR